MGIEDYLTQEVEQKGITIHVTSTLDISGYAKEVADKVDDQLFHSIAVRKGYVKERTCYSVKVWFKCSECGSEYDEWDEHGVHVDDGYSLKYCPNCGAKVVNQ